MKKLSLTMVMTAMLMLLLSGCIFRTPDELYQLPARSPGYEKLTQAIDSLRRSFEMEAGTAVENAIIYSGDNTSSIQLQDLDGDGEQETAVTFLRVPGAELPLRICFFEIQPDESYQVSCIIEGNGAAIYAVDFEEFSGGGKKELVVSWQNSTTARQLGVYSLESTLEEDGELLNHHSGSQNSVLNTLPEATELMLTAYSGYSLLDIDQDTRTELAVVRLDPAGANSTVEVYGWRNDIFVSLGSTRLSTGITALNRVRSNFVGGSARALYITGTLLDGSKATDIVSWRGSNLVNLTLNPETGVSTETLLSYYGSINPSDVNGDLIFEMPRPRILPSYTEGVSSNFWLIDWGQYDQEGKFTYVGTTYHNRDDEWYFEVPEHWINQITISRNDSVSGERAEVFYHWNGTQEEPTPFMAIYQLTGVNRTARAARNGRFILSEDDSTIYAAAFLDSKWDCGLEEADVLDRFNRIVTDWTNE